MIETIIPGRPIVLIENLLMDYNGTLAIDGHLIKGVSHRLHKLASKINLVILTADTYGIVEESCRDLPVTISIINKGQEQIQKLEVLNLIGTDKTASIGNGANDLLMIKESIIGISVIGKEGVFSQLIGASDICVPDINTGLDLFLHPKRITSTLRL